MHLFHNFTYFSKLFKCQQNCISFKIESQLGRLPKLNCDLYFLSLLKTKVSTDWEQCLVLLIRDVKSQRSEYFRHKKFCQAIDTRPLKWDQKFAQLYSSAYDKR